MEVVILSEALAVSSREAQSKDLRFASRANAFRYGRRLAFEGDGLQPIRNTGL
jgi:hypothetical protein